MHLYIYVGLMSFLMVLSPATNADGVGDFYKKISLIADEVVGRRTGEGPYVVGVGIKKVYVCDSASFGQHRFSHVVVQYTNCQLTYSSPNGVAIDLAVYEMELKKKASFENAIASQTKALTKAISEIKDKLEDLKSALTVEIGKNRQAMRDKELLLAQQIEQLSDRLHNLETFHN